MTARRRILKNTLTLAAGSSLTSASLSASAQGASGGRSVVVRVSRGAFDPALADEWERRLASSGDTLMPAIKKLKGLLHYYAGLDKVAGSMINVSVWDSLESAKQMESLAEMGAAGREFVAAGIKFERPIINYNTVWTL